MKLEVLINVMSPEVTKNYIYADIIHPAPAGEKRCISNALIPIRPFLGVAPVSRDDHNINKEVLGVIFQSSLDGRNSKDYALLVIHPLAVDPGSRMAYSATITQVIESVLESHPKIDDVTVTYVAPGMTEYTMSYTEFCITQMS